jgi:hypothetical protein
MSWFGWLIAAAAIGAGGYAIYDYEKQKAAAANNYPLGSPQNPANADS